MNIRLIAALAAALVLSVPASADDAGFEQQVVEVSMETASADSSRAGYMGVDGDSSWNEIARAGLHAAFPKVFHSGTFYPVNGLCVDGDDLSVVGGTRRCVRWSHRGGRHDDVCREWSTGPVSFPITSKAQRCVKWRAGGRDRDRVCTQWETYEKTIPLSYEVPVVANHNREHGERTVFTKTYAIPACK